MNYNINIGTHVKFQGCGTGIGHQCINCRECKARAHDFLDDNNYVHGVVTGMSCQSYYIKVREDLPVHPISDWERSTTVTIAKNLVVQSERNKKHVFDKRVIKDEPEEFNIGVYL